MYLWIASSTHSSLSVIVIASFKDVCILIKEDETLFFDKVKEVVVMGGVQPFEEGTADAAAAAAASAAAPAPAATSLPPSLPSSLKSVSAFNMEVVHSARGGSATTAPPTAPPTAAPTSPMLLPDTAHNNLFDHDAAEFVYRRCQEMGTPLRVVSRFAAYACCHRTC